MILEKIEEPKEILDKKKLSEIDVELSLKTSELKQLYIDIQLAQEDASELNRVTQNLKEDIESLHLESNNKKKTLVNEIAKLIEEVESYKGIIGVSLFEINKNTEKVNSLNTSIEQTKRNLISIGTELKDKESVYNGYVLKHTALSNEISKKSDHIKELEYIEKDLETKKIQLESTNNKLESANTELSVLLKKIETTRADWANEYTIKKQELNVKEGDLSVKEIFLDDKLEKLKVSKSELEKFYGRKLNHINLNEI